MFTNIDIIINIMETLEEESLLYILNFLDMKSLLRFRRVSKYYCNLTRDDTLWKSIYKSRHSDVPDPNILRNKSWEWLIKVYSLKLSGPSKSLCTNIYRTGTYSGEWYNWLPNGFGIYQSGSHTLCGEWIDGNLQGFGTEKYNDDIFEGIFEENGPSFGKKRYHDGSIYDGTWKNNTRHGHGTYEWSSGDKYIGEWVSGDLSGRGTYYWADGRKYTGAWCKHHATGLGIGQWADNYRYEGLWKSGKRDGYGKLFHENKLIYEGYWKNDFPENHQDIKWNGFCTLSADQQRLLVSEMKKNPTCDYATLFKGFRGRNVSA